MAKESQSHRNTGFPDNETARACAGATANLRRSDVAFLMDGTVLIRVEEDLFNLAFKQRYSFAEFAAACCGTGSRKV